VEHRIEYSPDAEEHLYGLTARQRTIVLDGVDEQLVYQPTTETRNRKRMRPNPIAPWELRLGNLRVYYDVLEDPQPLVIVVAVGRKVRNQVYIRDEAIDL
jgi:mRNA-degrading endonuclease RelE of RelBE toxin-antitoxin system